MTGRPIKTFKAQDIIKHFGDTCALSGVSLELKSGEIHGLVGHNGAGKSTLLRVFSGSIVPDAGVLLDNGVPIVLREPGDALSLGVATVYQELSLLENLTVAENAYLGNEITNLSVMKRKAMEEQTRQLLKRFDIDVSPREKLGELSVAQRQLIEIAVAVHRNADFLLLDEPTTSLEASQIERTLDWIETLAKRENIGILFIGHKIDELLKVSDKITVLADGKMMLQQSRKFFNRSEIVNAVIGKVQEEGRNYSLSIGQIPADKQIKEDNDSDIFALKVRNLRSEYFNGIQLQSKKNHVLGIYGLVGSGRSRFLRTMIGVEPFTSGEFELLGKSYEPGGPRKAASQGIVYLTEDRKINGFIPLMSARKNVVLPVLKDYSKFGSLDLKGMQNDADEILSELNVRGDLGGSMIQLSGGNQQKVLFARAIRQRPRLLLLDEPTKGVDIGAKNEIYRLILFLTKVKNISVIMVSSEEQEILDVSDEIVIFKHGHCDGTVYDPKDMDDQKLRALAWHSEEVGFSS
jgi:ribose transport system ATP-binding protein